MCGEYACVWEHVIDEEGAWLGNSLGLRCKLAEGDVSSKAITLRMFGASWKTPWHLEGAWEGRLAACGVYWHLTFEKEGLLS